MRSQHAPTPSAGNRQARRKARKLAERQRRRSGATAPAVALDLNNKLAVAREYAQANRFDDAVSTLNSILSEYPESALAYNLIGGVLDRLGKSGDAYKYHKRAVTLAPDNAQFWRDFGRCLHALKQDDATVVAFERAASLLPENADCLQELGAAYSSAGNTEDAVAAFEKSLALNPDNPIVWTELGSQLQMLGDFARARDCFEKALHIDPESLEAHYNLTLSERTDCETGATISKLKAIVASPGLTPRRRSLGLFALARLYERQKDHDSAFEYYAEANGILKTSHLLDWTEAHTFIDDTISGYRPETFERLGEAGSPSDLPIFIVGMPRSGSTLVEQILSSHPRVRAGGEVRSLGQLATGLAKASSEALCYPRDVAVLEPHRLSAVGDLYLSQLQRSKPSNVTRVTDKQLYNHFHLGLIAVLFPNASIVHCRRDPLDTCLSCYFQNFQDSDIASLTNDFDDLARFYGIYQKIIGHWRKVLPRQVLDIDYEVLVENQEAVSRKLIDFVGLDWDDACLSFHSRRGSVQTASAWQVRQPIYTSSIGKWRRYEKHLNPLKQALANVA